MDKFAGVSEKTPANPPLSFLAVGDGRRRTESTLESCGREPDGRKDGLPASRPRLDGWAFDVVVVGSSK